MATLDLSYEEFATLCDSVLGGAADLVQEPPRAYGGRGCRNPRFRGRWFMASGGFALAAGGRPGLRRRSGFPRGRS
jgi:hypothetical protein